MKTETETKYSIYLVPNGRTTDFNRGMLGLGYPDECKCWGYGLTKDELRNRMRELAEEAFHPEGYEGEWDRVCEANDIRVDGLDDEEKDRRRQIAVDAAYAAMDKYIESVTAEDDPLLWTIDWGDLKYVRVKVCEEE